MTSRFPGSLTLLAYFVVSVFRHCYCISIVLHLVGVVCVYFEWKSVKNGSMSIAF